MASRKSTSDSGQDSTDSSDDSNSTATTTTDSLTSILKSGSDLVEKFNNFYESYNKAITDGESLAKNKIAEVAQNYLPPTAAKIVFSMLDTTPGKPASVEDVIKSAVSAVQVQRANNTDDPVLSILQQRGEL